MQGFKNDEQTNSKPDTLSADTKREKGKKNVEIQKDLTAEDDTVNMKGEKVSSSGSGFVSEDFKMGKINEETAKIIKHEKANISDTEANSTEQQETIIEIEENDPATTSFYSNSSATLMTPDENPAGSPQQSSNDESTSFHEVAFEEKEENDKKKLEKFKIDRKKEQLSCRLIAFFLNFLIFYGIYYAYGSVYWMVSTYTFDSKADLTIEVNGCSIEVRPCKSCNAKRGKLIIERSLLDVNHFAKYTFHTNNVEHLIADNDKDCDQIPFARCSAICLISVLVPANANEFSLIILQTGEQVGVTTNVRDVTLSSLQATGSTMSVNLFRSNVKSRAVVQTAAGGIISRFGDYGQAIFVSRNKNIFVETSYNPNEALNVFHRTTSISMCIAASRGNNMSSTLHMDPNGIWGECPLDPDFVSTVLRQYDISGNQVITEAEFNEGLNRLPKCCGGGCPLFNNCVANYKNHFIPLYSPYVGRDDFIAALRHENDTSLVPGCYRRVVAGDSKTLRNPLYLWSDYGKILVKHTTNSNDQKLNASVEYQQTSVAVKFLEHVDIKIVQSDADDIIKNVQNKFNTGFNSGLKSDIVLKDEPVYVIFEVEKSPGIPAAKFIYTNKPVFLTLEPALLSVLSGGLIRPTIVRQKVAFYSNGCYSEEFKFQLQGEERRRRLNLMGNAILRLLVPFQKYSLRGELALVEEDHSLESRQIYILNRDLLTDEQVFIPYRSSASAKACFYISLLIGFVGALSAITVFRGTLKSLFISRVNASKLKRKILTKRSNLESKIAATSIEEDVGDIAVENPFSEPIEIINEVLVFPIRRACYNSLSSFILRECKIRHTVVPMPSFRTILPVKKNLQTDMEITNYEDLRLYASIAMSEFISKYEKFCFNYNLNMEKDMTMIRRTLIRKFGIRTRTFLDDQIIGLKWKSGLAWKKIEHVMRNGVDFGLLIDLYEIDIVLENDDYQDYNRRLFKTFIDIMFDVTERSSDFVSLNSLLILDEQTGECVTAHGLAEAYEEFVKTYSKRVSVTLPNDCCRIEETVLESLGTTRNVVRTETIPGLRWLNNKKGEKSRFSWHWYVVQYISVLIHQIMFLFGPFCSIYWVLSLNSHFALTSAPMDQDYLTKRDVSELMVTRDALDRRTLKSLNVVAIFCAITIVISYAMLLLNYCDFFLPPCVKVMRRVFFSWTLSTLFFCILNFAVTSSIWILLAGFIKPSKYLPYGTAILTFVALLSLQYKKSMKATEKLKAAVEKRIRESVRLKIRQAVEAQKKKDNQNRNRNGNQNLTEHLGKDEENFDPNDIFTIAELKGQGRERGHHEKGFINREEFDDIFAWLDLKIEPGKLDIMFAFCDRDCHNKISRDEFVEAWDWLEQSIFESVAAGVGLSNTQKYLSLLSLSLLLIGVIVFLFLAVTAFSTNGSFVAVVQSAGITGAGSVATHLKAKPKGEELAKEKEELKKFVSFVV